MTTWRGVVRAGTLVSWRKAHHETDVGSPTLPPGRTAAPSDIPRRPVPVRQLPGRAPYLHSALHRGPHPDCDVQVVHPLVSRRHLLVTPRPDGWLLECQGRNGMLVNGRATRSALITEGTRVQLGDASGPGLAPMPLRSTTAAAPAGPGPQAPAS